MRASEANHRAYEKNASKKLLKNILPKIQKAADKGKFELVFKMGDSRDSYTLQDALIKLGYKVTRTSEQCSPNDSYYFLRINWDDET